MGGRRGSTSPSSTPGGPPPTPGGDLLPPLGFPYHPHPARARPDLPVLPGAWCRTAGDTLPRDALLRALCRGALCGGRSVGGALRVAEPSGSDGDSGLLPPLPRSCAGRLDLFPGGPAGSPEGQWSKSEQCRLGERRACGHVWWEGPSAEPSREGRTLRLMPGLPRGLRMDRRRAF